MEGQTMAETQRPRDDAGLTIVPDIIAGQPVLLQSSASFSCPLVTYTGDSSPWPSCDLAGYNAGSFGGEYIPRIQADTGSQGTLAASARAELFETRPMSSK